MRIPRSLAAAALLLCGVARAGDAPPGVYLSGRTLAQGDPAAVVVTLSPPADELRIVWRGREYPMARKGDRHVALLGIDLEDPPGRETLFIRGRRGAETIDLAEEVVVLPREFPVQELTLPREMTTFDPPTLERIRKEAARLSEIFARPPGPPAWDLPLVPPVEAFAPAGFGSRRRINGEPRAPHAGVDVTLPEGTPVAAVAGGTVAFAGEQFFGGNSVVLDHGGGFYSVYYHLQRYDVREGDRVRGGDPIGAVGASGRATGPHLHFGVRLPGGRVDPSRLYGISLR